MAVVLIVEDNFLTRMLAVSAFLDAGFVVWEADDAAQALALLETSARGVYAVFIDVDMPGAMNGLQLAVFARERWPSVGFVVTSGETKVTAANMPAGVRFFSKPYDTGRVIDHIRGMEPLGAFTPSLRR